MSFLTNTQKQKKFITKNFKNTLEEKTDVILSPEFYWTKRLTLNINFSYEIKKMAPSIFDGFLPSGKFDYKVFKLAPHEFIIIAYDLETIKNELSSLGIDLLLVDKIYALQSEFLNDEISLKVDHEFGVASHNDIIVYTPLK
ncbi:MAG: hypothetical protein J0647_03945, partial [Campylobacteraceae bacterium]|nr:hypothetical protein [Campylobacteraceae bacterium]